jgi:hypothetical protein
VSALFLFCFHSSLYEATFAVHISVCLPVIYGVQANRGQWEAKRIFLVEKMYCFQNVCSLKQLHNTNVSIILLWYVILECLIKKQHFT